MSNRYEYYSPEEVAYLYGIKEMTVCKWIREGKLNAVFLEGDWDGIGRKCWARSYGIPKDELTNFDPITGRRALNMLERASRKHETESYMEWLDERTDQLYKEIEFINQMKEYVKQNEPYF